MNKSQAKYLISDKLWAKIEPLLPARPPHPLGCHNSRNDSELFELTYYSIVVERPKVKNITPNTCAWTKAMTAK